MKKSSRRDHPSDPSSRNRRDYQPSGGNQGRWEFLVGGSLITVGSTGTGLRAAYRTAEGELRFLPL